MGEELDAVAMNMHTIAVRRQPYERRLILLRTVYFLFPGTTSLRDFSQWIAFLSYRSWTTRTVLASFILPGVAVGGSLFLKTCFV